jgi:hypothetical protein
VPWSRKARAIPLLPPWAVRPVQSLSACRRVHFTVRPVQSLSACKRVHFTVRPVQSLSVCTRVHFTVRPVQSLSACRRVQFAFFLLKYCVFLRCKYWKSTCKMINFAGCASKSVLMLPVSGIKPWFLTGLSPSQVAVRTDL